MDKAFKIWLEIFSFVGCLFCGAAFVVQSVNQKYLPALWVPAGIFLLLVSLALLEEGKA